MKKQELTGEVLSAQPRAKHTNIVVRELEQEVLLYQLDSHQAFCLNKIAAKVWQLCDGTHSLAAIIDSIRTQFMVDEDIVWLAIKQLEQSSLLESRISDTLNTPRISRRWMMQQLGIGGLSLPLVTAIIAPTAVQAQSCGDPNNNRNFNPDGCTCQASDDCVSGCCGVGRICAASRASQNGTSCRLNCECISNYCPSPANVCQTRP